MQTDKISIRSTGEGMQTALEEATKFASYTGLDRKQALRVRLLTEETLGMIGAITGEFIADFWIESSPKCAVKICLEANAEMDFQKKQDLINASTDKKNAAAKGFMGKIRQLIENSLYSIDEAGKLEAEYGSGAIMYANMGMCEIDPGSAMHSMNYMWSLENYRQALEGSYTNNEAAHEAWDELEKSIVANIADDVRVGVRGNKIEFTIEKRKF
jgi:hypothetical protein